MSSTPALKTVGHGVFQLHGQEVWGELRLDGPETKLILRSEHQTEGSAIPAVLHGRMHDFKLTTCLGCVGSDSPNLAFSVGGGNAATWKVFPHFVLSGREHFDPSLNLIQSVRFSTHDIYQIFDDFDSFGIFRNGETKQKIAELIPPKIGDRETPMGDQPTFAYFAGRRRMLRTELPFGTFEVLTYPGTSSDASGATIKNNMAIQLEFDPAVKFEDCISKVSRVGQFISLIAGRSQGIENIQLDVEGSKLDQAFTLFWPLGPKQSSGQELDTPSWIDMPLDGIRRPEEFSRVLNRWFASDSHKLARARLHACRDFGNHYTLDRLVAAANLFELTKKEALPDISAELMQACTECIKLLEATEKSDDRTSAIEAMKRVGKPTMMKKIVSRAELLKGHFQFTHLPEVLRQAVLCRNHFVHGSDDKRLKYDVVEPHVGFLTDTLEFVFAATELIECGWRAAEWRLRPHTGNHWFSRFSAYFNENSQRLVSDLATAKIGAAAEKKKR